jgi:hypothetical protein
MLAEGVEYIPYNGSDQLLAQQLKQLSIIFPFHALSSVVAASRFSRSSHANIFTGGVNCCGSV